MDETRTNGAAAYDVVVLGAGYAGLMAALRLRRHRQRLRIALVSASDCFVERVRLQESVAKPVAPRIPSIAANRILLKQISVIGAYWGGYLERHPEYLAQTQAALYALYEAGKIKPVVSQSFHLAEAPAALRALAGRNTWGKVVLTM